MATAWEAEKRAQKRKRISGREGWEWEHGSQASEHGSHHAAAQHPAFPQPPQQPLPLPASLELRRQAGSPGNNHAKAVQNNLHESHAHAA